MRPAVGTYLLRSGPGAAGDDHRPPLPPPTVRLICRPPAAVN